jgi:CBS domain containing-hemolysin-like protein
MILDILLTVFLVLLNGFFVAAEFAIVKVRSSQMDIKASKGNRFAKISQKILGKLDSYLSACQVGITIASLALGWIGEKVVARIIDAAMHSMGYDLASENVHTVSIVIAFTMITVMHIVFGEQAPKIVAIKFPLPTTLAIAVPLRIFYFIFRPFIWFVNEFSNLLLRLVGINAKEMGEIHSEEELRMLLTESEEGGAIKQSEHELIQNVFEFDDRVVKQILIPRTKISAIDIETSREEVIQRVIDEGYSRMPIYQDSLDNIVGLLYVKDIIRLIQNDKVKSITDIMRPAYFVPLNKRINDLLREFQTQHIQLAVVTNEFGGTAGIVTMEDIIEELVGEIQDEYDDEKPVVEKKSETEFIVNAMANITDINDVLPIALPENSNYDTLSGLLNYIYGRIPAVNEKRVYGGYEFTIVKRFKHSVDSVKMTVVDTDSVDEEE